MIGEKQEYSLSYTRDRQIITQQGWYFGNDEGIKRLLGLKNSNLIPIIFYYSNGPIEIWDNVKAINNIQEEVVKKNKQNKGFCKEAINTFDKIRANFFDKKWKDEFTNDKKELKQVAQKFSEMCPYYVFIYYSLLTNSAPDDTKKDVQKWKERDVFFENTGRYVEKSLESIYPEIKYFVNYVKAEEIDKLPTKEILQKRKLNYIFVPRFFDEIINIADFNKEHTEFIFIKEKIVKTSLLKGQAANGGRVIGKVRLLRTREDMDRVLDGEIIVSPMTTPEFLPAMKRASAFVTDEGGLLSHAAIVARELKKPCIVGTKIGTKILKDGDTVEVDADKGIVRIIK